MAKAMAKDVAEALRRAAEADSKAKANVRDLAEARAKAEEVDKVLVEAAGAKTAAEERAKLADAELARVQKELGEQLAKAEQELAEHVSDTQRELAARAEQTQRDLRTKTEEVQLAMTAKLDQLARELAAERSSSLQLVDRKTSLERELGEARKYMERTEQAESRVVELEVQLEQLQERADDLESGLAVAENRACGRRPSTTSRTKTKQLEKKLAAAERTIADSTEQIEKLRQRAALLETQMRGADEANNTAEAALRDARTQIADPQSAPPRSIAGSARPSASSSRRRSGARRRSSSGWPASSAPRKPRISRSVAPVRCSGSSTRRSRSSRGWSAISRARRARKSAESDRARRGSSRRPRSRREGPRKRVRDLVGVLGDIDRQARESAARIQSLETELQRQTGESRGLEERCFGDLQKKLTAQEQRAIAAEQRADRCRGRRRERRASPPRSSDEARARIAELEQELSKADNVRSFAAETEREIAGLQRELREAKGHATRLTLERDRLESEIRDARGMTPRPRVAPRPPSPISRSSTR